jgi:hypothetical protein
MLWLAAGLIVPCCGADPPAVGLSDDQLSRPALLQLDQSGLGIALGPLQDLPQQIEDGQQARLGGHELARTQAGQPLDRLLRRWGDIEVRLVPVGHVVFAQPAAVVARPGVEILHGRPGKRPLATPGPQLEEVIIETRGQLPLRERTDVRLDEHPTEEAHDQRRVLGA